MSEYMNVGLSTSKAERLYGDIICLPRPVSRVRRAMPTADRAAQFSSFAALTGYEESVKETARQTSERREPDEERCERLNSTLRLLEERADDLPLIRVVYFERDSRKSGGEYVDIQGRFKRIDEEAAIIVFTDGNKVPILDLWEIGICEGTVKKLSQLF